MLLQGSLHHTGGFVLTSEQDAPIQVPMVIVDADSNDTGLRGLLPKERNSRVAQGQGCGGFCVQRRL